MTHGCKCQAQSHGLRGRTDCRTEDTDLEKWSPGGGGGGGGGRFAIWILISAVGCICVVVDPFSCRVTDSLSI